MFSSKWSLVLPSGPCWDAIKAPRWTECKKQLTRFVRVFWQSWQQLVSINFLISHMVDAMEEGTFKCIHLVLSREYHENKCWWETEQGTEKGGEDWNGTVITQHSSAQREQLTQELWHPCPLSLTPDWKLISKPSTLSDYDRDLHLAAGSSVELRTSWQVTLHPSGCPQPFVFHLYVPSTEQPEWPFRKSSSWSCPQERRSTGSPPSISSTGLGLS